MKKIILFITILSLIIGLKINVYALTYSDKFYISDVIDNIYYGKTKNGVTEYRKAKFKKRASDNKIVYCIEPFVDLNEDATLKGYDYNYEQLLNISKSDWERISLLAYYGYGYKGHTAEKWYPITQILIWKTIDKNASFFWTDTFEGNKVNKFESETKELENLVSNHKKLPSFANHIYDVSINEHITLNDSNSVLVDYDISTNKEFDVVKDGNNLIFNTKDEDTIDIYFTKKDKKYNTPPIVYVSSTYQNTLLVGSFEEISTKITLNIDSGSIKIKKIDSENSTTIPQGQASLIGAVYEVYKYDKLVGEITIGENNEGIIDHLQYGRYKIKEKKSGVGYKIDSNEYEININSVKKDYDLELKNEVIKNKIKIYKYFGDNNTKRVEKGITFVIYDSNNNKYGEVTTDENGIIEIELPYGKYLFRQKNTTEGYKKVDDFNIEVKEESNNIFEYYLNDIKVPDTNEDLKTIVLSILLLVSGILLILVVCVKD
ncbi:MAG: Cys-Gln thioester bond-forming surface protein [Bacilli bacterium]|nr:Cys-Gln thioester bond-forming surface protein [Bacilli bacterium]